MDDADRALIAALGWRDASNVEGWIWVVNETGDRVIAETYYNFVHEAEAEIARRGLIEQYASAAMELLGVSCYSSTEFVAWANTDEIGLVLTAPPDVRVRAMLAALGVDVQAHR